MKLVLFTSLTTMILLITGCANVPPATLQINGQITKTNCATNFYDVNLTITNISKNSIDYDAIVVHFMDGSGNDLKKTIIQRPVGTKHTIAAGGQITQQIDSSCPPTTIVSDPYGLPVLMHNWSDDGDLFIVVFLRYKGSICGPVYQAKLPQKDISGSYDEDAQLNLVVDQVDPKTFE